MCSHSIPVVCHFTTPLPAATTITRIEPDLLQAYSLPVWRPTRYPDSKLPFQLKKPSIAVLSLIAKTLS
jgi:hypothetical protein